MGGEGAGGISGNHSEEQVSYLSGHINMNMRTHVSSSPRTARTLSFPDCSVAAVVVAVGQLFVGARRGGASFGLGGGASAEAKGRTGTRPAQGGLQRAGCREAR